MKTMTGWKNLCSYLLTTAGMLFLTGCAFWRPVADPTRFYILDVAEYGSAALAREEAVTLNLNRVQVARYLDAPGIAVRPGDNRIYHSQRHRWVESLEHGVARLMAETLSREPGISHVTRQPGVGGVRPEYDLNVSVLRAEGVAGRFGGAQAVFHATWELRSGPEGELLLRGRLQEDDLPWDGNDFDRLVASLSEAVTELSRQVARALEETLPADLP